MESREKKVLLGLFCFAFIVRLLFFFAFLADNPCKLTFDSGHYHNLALSLIDGQGLSNADGSPQFYRLPGYPIFLALCYGLFGVNPDVALFIQMLLASLIPVLIFMLTRLIFPRTFWCAALASVLASLHLGLVLFSGLVMTETLFELFFLFFVYVTTKKIYEPQLPDKYFLYAGLSLGAAGIIRPVGQYLIPLALAVVFLFYDRPMREVLKAKAWLGAGALAMVGPWLLRNFLLTGYLFFSTLPGPHFFNHGAIPLTMRNNNMSYTQAKTYMQDQFNKLESVAQELRQRRLSEIERSNLQQKLAIEAMRQNYWTSIVYFVMNMFKTSSSLYSSELLFIDSGGSLPEYDVGRGLQAMIGRYLYPTVSNKAIVWAIYYELLFWTIIFFGMLGFFIVSFWTRYYWYIYALFWPYVLLFIVLSIVCGYARLRLPIEPFLIMLSSEFWISFVCGKKGMN
ncbi:MAG: glycosyltransferase family 39 protein [Epsilonproteobacteria bacterium]|nr:glycosyltransferase family 39 protein [Campylobacterota bacterium]